MEREFKSDSESYEIFVGSIPVVEFVSQYEGSITDAVKGFIEEWPYEEPVPSWLEESIERYCTEQLENIE